MLKVIVYFSLAASWVLEFEKFFIKLMKFILKYTTQYWHFFFISFFFLVFRGRVSLYSPGCPETHSRPGWTLIQKSTCLCLPHAGIKGMCHHCPALLTFFKVIKIIYNSLMPLKYIWYLLKVKLICSQHLLKSLWNIKHDKSLGKKSLKSSMKGNCDKVPD